MSILNPRYMITSTIMITNVRIAEAAVIFASGDIATII
ncbi:hypothetical protein E24_00083 [Faustovirus]|nr:hypothetical protein E24_00083 [Faustovirus]AMN84986.1 hypothetical protein E23_00083 [Faustovirus]